MRIFVCDDCGATIPNEAVNGGSTTYKTATTAPGGFIHMTFKSGEKQHAHLCGQCQLSRWYNKKEKA